jgi:hypothetical protein
MVKVFRQRVGAAQRVVDDVKGNALEARIEQGIFPTHQFFLLLRSTA